MSTERDPNGFDQHEPGAKLDAGKAPVSQGLLSYFPRALLEVAKVSGHGAENYTWCGWLQVPDGERRYRDAMGRHILEGHITEYDQKSCMLHMAHVAWNSLAVLELMLMERETVLVDPRETAPAGAEKRAVLNRIDRSRWTEPR